MEEDKDKKVLIRPNKPLFLERYFGYDSEKWKAKFLKKLKSREVI